jgi:hypothetical protein
MSTKKGKTSRKLIRLEMSRLTLASLCLGLLLGLLWMFLLGLLLGKGITPANINVAEIKKRMMAEGIWPGSGRTDQSGTSPKTNGEEKNISLKDLEFYEELAKKKKARLQGSGGSKVPPQVASAQTPPPTTSPQRDVTPTTKQDTVRFTVQVASFKDLSSAKRFAANLKNLKPQPVIRQVNLAGKGNWYRVQVGELPSHEEASALGQRLAEQYHLQTFVMRLSDQSSFHPETSGGH